MKKLGDAVHAVTKVLGIRECDSCKQRREALNHAKTVVDVITAIVDPPTRTDVAIVGRCKHKHPMVLVRVETKKALHYEVRYDGCEETHDRAEA